MAEIVINTPKAAIGGIVLKAAGLIATTTAGTGALLDGGMFSAQVDWTAIDIDGNNELYIITMEANTRAAPTVWTEIGGFRPLGATEVVASSGDVTATGSIRQGFWNPYDYQVRYKVWVSGAGVSAGLNFAIKAYPIEDLGVIG
jgi:hypothetical protein